MDNIVVVSVVRDERMYERLVRTSFANETKDFIAFDNNRENLTIPRRYNSFLESYDYSREAWFVFCHEDFELLEPLTPHLKQLSKDVIYGVCGQSLKNGNLGYQLNSNKDGSQLEFRGKPIKTIAKVDTLDCCFLMVHSSLVRKHGLRFDEELTWDLYVEDFCIAAHANYGVMTSVIPLRTYHHSYGNIQPRFLEQLAYLRTKYCNLRQIYATTTAYSIGGDPAKLVAVDARLRRQQHTWLRHIFYKKYTHTGKLIIKLFSIPIWRQQIFTIEGYMA